MNPALPAYAELHCLSNFSFLRGASHPEELIARAQELGYSALALTDECSIMDRSWCCSPPIAKATAISPS